MLSDSALLGLPAPAKLNLFLHVVGRRPDGKHLLESVFTLIDLHDTIDLFRLEEPVVERTGDVLQRLRARQMRELASHGAADPLRPALVRMVLEELIVHDPCSYEVHFLDGTVRRVQTARYYA